MRYARHVKFVLQARMSGGTSSSLRTVAPPNTLSIPNNSPKRVQSMGNLGEQNVPKVTIENVTSIDSQVIKLFMVSERHGSLPRYMVSNVRGT